jgi:diguanylate cyclase (GGDEF)-like protein/PAS domain S-box-containing protein
MRHPLQQSVDAGVEDAVGLDVPRNDDLSAALEAAEARYRQLLHAMDQGVLVQDAQGLIVSVNPAACRILGLSESELLGLRRDAAPGWRLVDEDGVELGFDDLPGMRALLTGQTVESAVFGMYLPHLHLYRWLCSSSVPQFRPGESRPFQVISTFSDVTTLKRQADLFGMTQKLANIGGWEIDDLRNALFWTGQVYRIHDLEPGSTINETRALGFYASEGRERLRSALHDARTGSRGFELELPMTTALGRHRWVRIVGRPLVRHDRVYGVTGTLQDITDRKIAEEQLRRQASSDRVTGLANRDSLMAALDLAIATANSAGSRPALLFLDLDRFHLTNDTAGHAVGDRLLIGAADRLCRCLAGTRSLIARFSGDEFAVLLRDTRHDEALHTLADSIVSAFRKPFVHEGEEFTLTASIGIAVCPDDGETAQQLVNHADAAMTEAKRRGRNTWQRFTPELAHALAERTHLERLLRRALDNRELRLVYQPVFALADGRISGVEALLRWQSKSLGEIPPTRFIAHAENSGEIVRIGSWAVAQACRQWQAWHDAGMVLPHIAVNVSFRQLLSGSLLESVGAALKEYRLPAETLELELTERALVEDAADTTEIFAALKRMGVRLLIDDFGEGYSSLNYLRRLPLDGVKIGHAFVQGIPGNGADSAICEAIVRLADSLGLTVTAEGVETETQREFFARHHATYLQGYLLASPMDDRAIQEFLSVTDTRH